MMTVSTDPSYEFSIKLDQTGFRIQKIVNLVYKENEQRIDSKAQ